MYKPHRLKFVVFMMSVMVGLFSQSLMALTIQPNPFDNGPVTHEQHDQNTVTSPSSKPVSGNADGNNIVYQLSQSPATDGTGGSQYQQQQLRQYLGKNY